MDEIGALFRAGKNAPTTTAHFGLDKNAVSFRYGKKNEIVCADASCVLSRDRRQRENGVSVRGDCRSVGK